MDAHLDALEYALDQLTHFGWIDPYVVVVDEQKFQVFLVPGNPDRLEVVLPNLKSKSYYLGRTATRPFLMV